MVSITAALRLVKDDLPERLDDHVREALAQCPDHTWRERVLNPFATIYLFITQVLHGNTAIEHLRHLSGMTCSAWAYCQARMRLPLEVIQQVGALIAGDLFEAGQAEARWRGHRLWWADGSSFSMPDTPALQARFGQPGGQAQGCGFPVATLLTLCSKAGYIVKALALPLRTHEASQIRSLHDQMEPHDVLVADRGFCSYVHLALLLSREMHAIFRIHQRQIVDFTSHRKQRRQHPKGQRKGKPTSAWIKRLDREDQHARWFKPDDRPAWMTQEDYDALPDSLVVRELRFLARRKGFRSRTITLVTTLLDPQAYPAAELAEQYLGRWQIEVNFRHLKTTMGLEALKCRTVDGVLKELAIYILVYNLVRHVMLKAARRQGVPVDRISFLDALRLLESAANPNEWIDLIVNPARPGRVQPRVLKRRKKEYPLMTLPRQKLIQLLMERHLAA